jgi:hypothetical protein
MGKLSMGLFIIGGNCKLTFHQMKEGCVRENHFLHDGILSSNHMNIGLYE